MGQRIGCRAEEPSEWVLCHADLTFVSEQCTLPVKGKRLRLNDSQRRRLARKGKILGRKLLFKFAASVSPSRALFLTTLGSTESVKAGP